MKIIACFKSVPEELDITVDSNRTLNFAGAEWKIGQYDLNAIEAGAQLAKKTEGALLVLTAGGDVVENSKLKKSALSRGPEELYAVRADSYTNSDSFATAQLLAAAVNKIDGVDLVLCGEGSGDIYAQQVGGVLGGLLGWPAVNAVRGIEPSGDAIILERALEDSVELLQMKLPAVVCVTGDINRPRIPGMKDIMGAGKKPVTVWTAEDLLLTVEPGLKELETLAPEQTARKQIILGDCGDDSIEAFYQHLRKAL